MRSQEENVLKRDAEATRYFNESGEKTSKESFERELDFESQDLEEQRFEEEQSEEDEDTGSHEMAAEEEEAESFDPGSVVQKSVEYDQELEQEDMASSSGSWESGDEDETNDNRRGERCVAVVRETAADIPVSHLRVVSDADRRRKQQSTKTTLRGEQQLKCAN